MPQSRASFRLWLVSLLFVAFLSGTAQSTTWRDPDPFEARSNNGRFLARVTPAASDAHATGPQKPRLDVYAIDEASTRALWSTELPSRVCPENAYVSDDGEHIVTTSSSRDPGTGIVAFYNRLGQVRQYSFNHVFPEYASRCVPTLRDRLEDYLPIIGEVFPSDPEPSLDEKILVAGPFIMWQMFSLTFVDNDPKDPAFCIWLGWDNRWLAWHLKTGQCLRVTRARLARWQAIARELALRRLAYPNPDAGAFLLLGELRNRADRQLLEDSLNDPHFNLGSQGSAVDPYEILAYSPVRQLADRSLATWDGRRRDTHLFALFYDQIYQSLGIVNLQVTFAEPPAFGDGFIHAYLLPDATPRDAWQAAVPEHVLSLSLAGYPTINAENAAPVDLVSRINLAFKGVRPGSYWIKLVWDRRPPFTPRSSEITNPPCIPSPGDYVSAASPRFDVRAGENTPKLMLKCTTLVE